MTLADLRRATADLPGEVPVVWLEPHEGQGADAGTRIVLSVHNERGRERVLVVAPAGYLESLPLEADDDSAA